MPITVEIDDGIIVYRLAGTIAPEDLDRLLERPDLVRAVRSGSDRLVVVEASTRFHLGYGDLEVYHARLVALEAGGDPARRRRYAYVARTDEHRIALRLRVAMIETQWPGALEVFASDDEAEARRWLEGAGRARS
jgi:hypothetical protein